MSRLKQIAVPIGLCLVVGVPVTAGVWIPLAHGLDSGSELLPVRKLASRYQPSSRNLVVEGRLAVEHIVELSKRDDQGRTQDRRSYIPLVTEDWTPKAPVRVVYAAHAWAGYRLEAMAQATTHKGVLRDVLWEGLPGGVKAEFDKMGIVLDEDVRLVEEPKPAEDSP